MLPELLTHDIHGRHGGGGVAARYLAENDTHLHGHDQDDGAGAHVSDGVLGARLTGKVGDPLKAIAE